MSQLCPDIWNVLHDAIIIAIRGALPGDLQMELDCDYLRDRFQNPGDRFVLILRDCSRFAYVPWSDESDTIEDHHALIARRLWILSADSMDGWCKVHCSEAIVNGNGGWLEVVAAAVDLELDDGTPVSLDQLKTVARDYWEELSSDSRRQIE
jgi:hypothetical protein